MATQVHDMTVRFRVSGTLAASAAQQAKREGMTLSEFLRSAVRRELREAA